jgi:ketosteroid isomerase-like protein
MSKTEQSAVEVARRAMTAVEDGRRQEWLDCFAEDARVEDPVGHLPPLAGREALGGFWDNVISALSSTRFEVSHRWEAGSEALLLASVTIATPSGASASYDGAFNYLLGEDGRIASLRAFWDLPAVAASLGAGEAQPAGS